MHKKLYFVLILCLLAAPGCKKTRSTDELISAALSKNEGEQIRAVRLLQGRKGDAAKVVPVLILSLKSSHSDVRWSAAIDLGYYGEEAKEAIPTLEQVAKNDRDARVREGARVAIGRIDPSLATAAGSRNKPAK
jgi:hypothetical protein